MADSADVIPSSRPLGEEEQAEEGGGGSERDAEGGLTDAQTEVLERCLHALRHARNDSHTLAALLLVSVSYYRHSTPTLHSSLKLCTNCLPVKLIHIYLVKSWHLEKLLHYNSGKSNNKDT